MCVYGGGGGGGEMTTTFTLNLRSPMYEGLHKYPYTLFILLNTLGETVFYKTCVHVGEMGREGGKHHSL